MPTTLLPHQLEDAAFLASKPFAGNFSGMGSGKTLTAIEAIRLVGATRTVIVCPPIAMAMWKATIEEQLGLCVQLVKTSATGIAVDAAVHIMSYEIATRLVATLAGCRPDALICDESHALKSVGAKRTQVILGHKGLATYCKHVWLLTGTPITRHNDDLYPFLARADLQGLGTRCGGTAMERFKLRFCVIQRRAFPGMRRPVDVVVGSRNTSELNEWLFQGGLAVRRELKDVWASMPPLTINRLPVGLAMTDELREMLADMAGKTQRDIEQMIAKNDEALATTRRKLGEAKVSACAKEIAERIDAGAGPLLIGAWHTSVIDALAALLSDQGLTVGVLDGRTSPAKKQALQEAFNAKQLDVLIGQIAAMGVAINLQHGGNRIVVVEEDWSPTVMDQFFARLHRIGQTEHVHVDVLVSDTKLDQAVARIARAKARNSDTLLDQGAAA